MREFYTAIHPYRGDSVRVRGKLVSFSPTIFNTHTGFLDVFNEICNELIMHPSDEQIEEVRRLVCRLKKTWTVSTMGVLSWTPFDLNEKTTM